MHTSPTHSPLPIFGKIVFWAKITFLKNLIFTQLCYILKHRHILKETLDHYWPMTLKSLGYCWKDASLRSQTHHGCFLLFAANTEQHKFEKYFVFVGLCAHICVFASVFVCTYMCVCLCVCVFSAACYQWSRLRLEQLCPIRGCHQ